MSRIDVTEILALVQVSRLITDTIASYVQGAPEEDHAERWAKIREKVLAAEKNYEDAKASRNSE